MSFQKFYIVESKEDKLKESYKVWKKLINMSPKEIQSFLDSQDGKKAGLSREEASKLGITSGRDSARAIIRMLKTPFEDWSTNEFKWMNKQISFIKRMLGNKGPLNDDKGKPTRKLLALKVWGHNPLKKSS